MNRQVQQKRANVTLWVAWHDRCLLLGSIDWRWYDGWGDRHSETAQVWLGWKKKCALAIGMFTVVVPVGQFVVDDRARQTVRLNRRWIVIRTAVTIRRRVLIVRRRWTCVNRVDGCVSLSRLGRERTRSHRMRLIARSNDVLRLLLNRSHGDVLRLLLLGDVVMVHDVGGAHR